MDQLKESDPLLLNKMLMMLARATIRVLKNIGERTEKSLLEARRQAMEMRRSVITSREALNATGTTSTPALGRAHTTAVDGRDHSSSMTVTVTAPATLSPPDTAQTTQVSAPSAALAPDTSSTSVSVQADTPASLPQVIQTSATPTASGVNPVPDPKPADEKPAVASAAISEPAIVSTIAASTASDVPPAEAQPAPEPVVAAVQSSTEPAPAPSPLPSPSNKPAALSLVVDAVMAANAATSTATPKAAAGAKTSPTGAAPAPRRSPSQQSIKAGSGTAASASHNADASDSTLEQPDAAGFSVIHLRQPSGMPGSGKMSHNASFNEKHRSEVRFV